MATISRLLKITQVAFAEYYLFDRALLQKRHNFKKPTCHSHRISPLCHVTHTHMQGGKENTLRIHICRVVKRNKICWCSIFIRHKGDMRWLWLVGFLKLCLFCKRALSKRWYSAKETCNFHSHRISPLCHVTLTHVQGGKENTLRIHICRVVKRNKMPYLHRSLSSKEPYN